MTVASPCRKICLYDPAFGWCKGCGRTLAEIGAWGGMSDDDRGIVIAACSRRLEAQEERGPSRAEP